MATEKYAHKIRDFYRKHRRMPSYSEIGRITGLKSKNAVFKLVRRLVDDGYVEKDQTGRLLPKNLSGEARVLGLVEAGFPSPAEEELVDTMSLDEYLIENKEASFLLRVSGDSMKDAGIQEGDLVIVERGRGPRDGDIVVAEVDGEWTLKYYRARSGEVYLEPANEAYELIYPKESLNVAAIVKAVIRKY